MDDSLPFLTPFGERIRIDCGIYPLPAESPSQMWLPLGRFVINSLGNPDT